MRNSTKNPPRLEDGKKREELPAGKRERNAAQPADNTAGATAVDPTAADETDVLSDAELSLDTRAKAE
jgi:hypothetical protein